MSDNLIMMSTKSGAKIHSHNTLLLTAKMADSEDEDRSLNLTGFLFGNINEKGELEDTEILDEVICVIYVVIGMFKVLDVRCMAVSSCNILFAKS